MLPRLAVIVLVFALTNASLAAWENCEPIDHSGEYEDRFGRSRLARTDADLRELFENPTVIQSSAIRTDEEGAAVETLTETHAVFPVAASDMMATLTSNSMLTDFMPNLTEHEVVCRPAENVSRQRQRTDFGVLFFSLGAEYVIDVEFPFEDPDRYGSHWVLVESLDGRMAYIYGSWYFEPVVLDGAEVAYVRHYVRSGLTTRVPGVRAFVAPRLEGEITTLFNEFYAEAVRQHGRVARN